MPSESPDFAVMAGQLKQSQSPMQRWVGRSIEEIFVEGDFGAMYLKGTPPNPDWSQIPHALTIAGVRERSITTLGVIIPGQTSTPDKIMGRRLRDELKGLPMMRTETALMEMVWRYFTQNSRQTIGGLMLASYMESREQRVQVLYSKLLMRMARDFFGSFGFPNLTEDYLRTAAAAMVTNILRSKPPREGNPIILSTEDR